jgi:hypothetical protein
VVCLINACMVIAARVLVLRFHILRYLLSLPVSICGGSDLTNLTDSRPTIQRASHPRALETRWLLHVHLCQYACSTSLRTIHPSPIAFSHSNLGRHCTPVQLAEWYFTRDGPIPAVPNTRLVGPRSSLTVIEDVIGKCIEHSQWPIAHTRVPIINKQDRVGTALALTVGWHTVCPDREYCIVLTNGHGGT